MKAYEILPAGMTGSAMDGGSGAKKPKAYEILPGAGAAAQGLGGKSGGCGCSGSYAWMKDGVKYGCRCGGGNVSSSLGMAIGPASYVTDGSMASSSPRPSDLSDPIYGNGPKRVDFVGDPSTLVDRDSVPRWQERCSNYVALMDRMRNRIAALSGELAHLEGVQADFRTAASMREFEINGGMGPCAALRDAHAALAHAEQVAYLQGDHAASNALGRQATDFHDGVWLMCDASRHATNDRDRALYAAAAMSLDSPIGTLSQSISEARAELAALRTNYPGYCPRLR